VIKALTYTAMTIVYGAVSLVSPALADNADNVRLSLAITQGCRHLISHDSPEWEAGMCLGVIQGLLFEATLIEGRLGKGTGLICPPKGGSNEQAAQIIATFVDGHPENLHHPFPDLALLALILAWPCEHELKRD
jgi:hypothetical protein